MKPAPRGQHGFTLIEVLVALVMTGLVVGVVFQLFGGAIQGHARADRLTMALLVAESRLAELGATVKLKPSTRRGRTADGYRWTIEIRAHQSQPTGDATPLFGNSPAINTSPVRAFDVFVSVIGDRDGDRQVKLETMRLRARNRDE